MKRRYHKVTGGAAALTTGLLALSMAHAATINQVANAGSTIDWNSGTLWDGGLAPSSGNDYLTVAGLDASNPTRLGTNVTSRVRLLAAQPTFGGDSITVSPDTEILGKEAGTYTANVILNGGTLRWSPNTGMDGTMAGTINVAANSMLGSVQTAAQVFTIASTITGNATLRLAGGTSPNQTISFDDGVGTSLNGFTGTLDIGGGVTNTGGANLVTVDFNQPYVMGAAAMTMGNHATADILNLDANISVGTFTFNGTSLASDTYDVATLNATFGNGFQFTGTGTLTVTSGAPASVRVVSTNVITDGSGQVTEVQITFSGLDNNKTYALKRGSDLVTFPDTVDTYQPASGTEAFIDSTPLAKATSGKAFYILVDAP
jgi:hypothetical protein